MAFIAMDTLHAEEGNAWRYFANPQVTFPVNPGVGVGASRLAAIDHTSAPYVDGYNKIISGSGGSAQSLANLRETQRFALETYAGLDQGTHMLGGSEVGAGIADNAYYVAARDDGVACAVNAYLSVIEGNATRRATAISILEDYANVETFGPNASTIAGQGNTSYKPLINGLGMEGMVQALSVLGDFNGRSAIVNNFATYHWPALWHWGGGNWVATFAHAKLGIAVAAADQDLWDASLEYYDAVCKANIWISSDGALVNRLPNNPSTGSPINDSQYPDHWWHNKENAPNQQSGLWATVDATLSSENLVHGQYCEVSRDDSHVMMGLNGLIMGALCIEHQGYGGVDLYADRLVPAFEYQAGRINTILDAAGTPTGGGGWKMGWLPALATYGAVTLPNVAALVARDSVVATPGTANGHVMQGLLWPEGT